jgi:peptidoglycan/xylan/chitin deacetylase (PgdA/CDA1 family)
VSLTFDDGYSSQYTFVLPSINERGFKGTFFIFTDFVDYFNGWNWWKEAASKGHEIASHTKTHPYLTALPLSEAEYEISMSKALIDANIPSQKCFTFAYPYGDVNTVVKALVQKYYIGARGTGAVLNDSLTDTHNENAYDVIGYTVLQMKNLTDLAVSQKKWLIPCFHSFSPGEYGGWTSDQLLAYLDYLKGRSDLWITPFGTAIKYIKERGAATVSVSTQTSDMITLNLTDTLDNAIFDCPLTLRSEVPTSWTSVKVQQGTTVTARVPVAEGSSWVVYYDATPDKGIITLTSGAVSLQLIAVNDSYGTTMNITLDQATPGVLSNDTSPEGMIMTAQLVNGPSHGTITLNSNGSFVYAPISNYVGSDSFTYRVSDGTTNSNIATVAISVTSTSGVLFSDDFTRTPGAPNPLSPWTNGLGSWATTTGVLQGSGSLFSYSQIYYAPTPFWDNYAVEGRFQFPTTAFGGGIGCRVNPATGAQYSVWIFPDNSEGGGNVLKLGKMWDWTTFSGTPMAEASLPSVGTGWHTLKMVCNGNRIQVFYDGISKIDVTDNNYDSLAAYLSGGVGAAMLTLNTAYTMSADNVVVNSLNINLPPVAVNDSYNITANIPLDFAAPGVLSNDSDSEGVALTVQLVSGPSHGTIVLNSNGSFVYTPAAGYVGSDSFTYRANDGTYSSNVATVTITVVPALALSSLLLNPTSVRGGTTSMGTVTLSGPAPGGGVVVSLSDNSSSATVPVNATVPAGNTSATFKISTTVVTRNRSATITAVYGGVTKSAILTITR